MYNEYKSVMCCLAMMAVGCHNIWQLDFSLVACVYQKFCFFVVPLGGLLASEASQALC